MLRMWKLGGLLAFYLWGHSEVGMGEEAKPAPAAPDRASGPLELTRLQAKITPPPGWESNQEIPGISLVMKEPASDKPSYDKPKYNRNITLLTLHQPSPIDGQRLESLKADLTKQFSSTSGVSDFQIIEAKLFDYRNKNDGILVYSSMKLGEYSMVQMHVLVSGAEKQYLMTYTDLLERFNDPKDYGFAAAWSSMVSLEVPGTAPSRLEQNRPIYLGALAALFVFLGLGLWSFKRSRTSYRHFADQAVDGHSISRSSINIIDTKECSTF